jgi:hypothetical protein
LGAHDRAELEELGADPDLHTEVTDRAPWYGHGTVGVLIWRADVHAELTAASRTEARA